MSDLEQLTAAVDEALGLIELNPDEAAGVLRAAVAEHGHRRKTAVPTTGVVVGVCSLCDGDVIRTPGKGAECPCGFIMIPEHFGRQPAHVG